MNMKTKLLNSLVLLGCLAWPLAPARAADPAPLSQTEMCSFTGTVADATNTAGYTYVLVDTGRQQAWAVTTQFPVRKGDAVTVNSGMPMARYHSQSLNRDFAVVYFAASITVAGAAGAAVPALPPGHPALPGEPAPVLPPGHPSLTGSPAPAAVDLTGVKRAAGGKTIQEIFAAKSALAGKAVAVRGRVVKYSAMVMGKNWLHIRDGSGGAETKDNDLTVTTSTPAKLGDTVLVTGVVATDKDFGAGYKYPVILDDAQVIVE